MTETAVRRQVTDQMTPNIHPKRRAKSPRFGFARERRLRDGGDLRVVRDVLRFAAIDPVSLVISA
jgi:hypothetical protein